MSTIPDIMPILSAGYHDHPREGACVMWTGRLTSAGYPANGQHRKVLAQSLGRAIANGYGASVIDDGYGHGAGLYELAVLGPDGHLTYETPVTDDVLGYLSVADVAQALDKIEALDGAR